MTARFRRPASVAVFGWFASAAVACTDATVNTRPTVRDSVGVEIIEYPRLTELDWVLSVQPTLDVDAAAGQAGEFFRVSDANILANGAIAVVNAGTHQVRIFDPEGALTVEFGRRGRGPGEFQNPYRVLDLPPDRLIVSDPFQPRLSIFDRSGRLVDEAPMSTLGSIAIVVGWLTGDTVVTGHFAVRPSPDAFLPQFMQYTLYAWTTGVTHSVAQVPSGTIGFIGGREPWGIVGGALFEPMAQAATANRLLVLGDALTPELRFYNASQVLRRILRWDERTHEVTSDDVDAFRDAWLDQMRSADRRAMMAKQVDATPVAEHFPSIGGLRVDNDERIWVKEYVKPRDKRQTWHIFDLDGPSQFRVDLPLGLEFMDAAADQILVLERDELDVEHVHVYRLVQLP